MTRHAAIVSTGGFIPEQELTNDDLRRRLGPEGAELVDKMEQRTGILTRFLAPETWSSSDLALPAARTALERAGIRADQVDLIVLGTDTPDYITPATSVVLQHKLGATSAGTFDVGCACASFPTGVAAAAGMIATNPSINTVLVVGVYLMHKLADPDDPVTFFYGDGAGAAVLTSASRPGFVTSALQADGSYHPRWGIFSGGTFEPASERSVAEGRTRCRLIEAYPAEVNHEGWPRLVRRLAHDGGFAVEQIDFAIFTQVRRPSIELVMQELGLPLERTQMVMHKWGYTGSACIPLALDDALADNRINSGDLVVLVGSGVGYNQAGVALRWV